jgi:type I restriction enzyme S subunit
MPDYGLNIPAESYAVDGLRFIRTTDITERGELTPVDDGVFIDPSEADPSSRLQDGDLLFSRSGTLGRGLLYRRDMGAATFAGYLVRFRPHPDNDPRYLYYCSLADFFQDTVHIEAVSSTISNFNAERYANLRLPWWSPNEQRAIADFLDAETARIDALIAKKRRLAALVEARFSRAVEVEVEHLIEEHGSIPLKLTHTHHVD